VARVLASSGSGGTYAGEMVATQVRHLRAARRRKRRMALGQHDLNPEQWTALQIAWGGCAYCGAIDKPLQRDCVLPISRGGRYTLDNVVPVCAACNRSKCNDEVTGWLRASGWTSSTSGFVMYRFVMRCSPPRPRSVASATFRMTVGGLGPGGRCPTWQPRQPTDRRHTACDLRTT
jgi:hypothetical protein